MSVNSGLRADDVSGPASVTGTVRGFSAGYGAVRSGPPIPAPRLRSDCLEFGAFPGAVPSARLHVRDVLWEWGLGRLADSAESVVAELVANAVVATRAVGLDNPVRLTLLAGPASVLVIVWDAMTDPPIRAEAGLDDESGRGLVLVEAFSARWDWKPAPPERGGKVVRALIDTP